MREITCLQHPADKFPGSECATRYQRIVCQLHDSLPPRWPRGLESGRSGVRIPLATGFIRGRVWHSRVSAGTCRPGVSIL